MATTVTVIKYPSGQTQYDIPFDYLARKFVIVSLRRSTDLAIDNVLTPVNDYKFLNANTIEIIADTTGYDTIQIKRFTGTELVVDFRDGSVLTAANLTNAELQAIHIAEEGREQTLVTAEEFVLAAQAYAQSAAGSAASADASYNLIKSIIDSAAGAEALIALGDTRIDRGDAYVRVVQPFTGALTTRTQHDKNAELLSMADFTGAAAAVTAAIASTNAILFNNPNAFNLTVGAGGQFATLMDAIYAAQRIRPLWKNGNNMCTIRLNSGFVLREQLTFGGGVDLSWIRITSQDAVVYADTSAFTLTVRTYYEYKYLFYIKDGANSPVFGFQIEENRANSDVCAFVVSQCSRLNFYPKSGARKFYVGIHASFGSTVMAYHTGSAADSGSVAANMPAGYYVCDFSHSVYSSIQATNGVILSMPISKFNNCQSAQAAVNLIYNCFGDFQGSNADDCQIGWNCRDSSVLNIRDHMTRRCTNRGLTMIHNSHCDARRHDVDESSTVTGTTGRVLEPSVQKGFYGCALGARIDGAGTLDLAGNDMRNCGVAVNGDNGAVVSAKGLDVSGATDCAFKCQGGSTIAVPRLCAENVAKLCELWYGTRLLSRWFYATTTVTFEQNTRFIDLRVGAELAAQDVVITGDCSLIAEAGSKMELHMATLKVRAVRSFTGSKVDLTTSTMDPAFNRSQPAPGGPQYIISGGGWLGVVTCSNTDGSAKTYSTAKNSISGAGIICDA